MPKGVRVQISPCEPYALLAQLAEQRTFNPWVSGSSPEERTIYGVVLKWFKRPVLKIGRQETVRGFKSYQRRHTGEWPSGQRQLTVNQPRISTVVQIHSLPPNALPQLKLYQLRYFCRFIETKQAVRLFKSNSIMINVRKDML